MKTTKKPQPCPPGMMKATLEWTYPLKVERTVFITRAEWRALKDNEGDGPDLSDLIERSDEATESIESHDTESAYITKGGEQITLY